MSFRSVLILLTFLSTLSRTVAELILLFGDSLIDLPIIIHLFSGVLILYGIAVLVYDDFKTLSPLPFVGLFLSEIIFFIINLFVFNHHFDKWNNVHIPALDQIVIGNFLTMGVNVIIVVYYFVFVRRRSPVNS